MRILLFGKNGQVGWELQDALAPLGTLRAVDYPEVDFLDLAGLRNFIREVKPDLIVNAAGYTAVDKAESEPEQANIINGEAPGVLAEEARRLGAGLVHYSTDYVFDGDKGAPYTEDDEPNPLNVYGKSKQAGDAAIASVGPKHLILRTSWVYGLRGSNFFLTMLRLAREREVIRVVDDQIGSPTWSRAIARTTAEILMSAYQEVHDRIGWDEKIPSGVYNYSSAGSTSWYGFASRIIKTDSVQSEYVVKKIIPISSEEFGSAAKRPNVSVLSKKKILDEFGVMPEDWQDQFASCSAEYSRMDR